MWRGEVWWVEFGPGIGGEIQKRRPAVIVSSDASNRHMNRLQVVALTSNVERLYSNEAYVDLNGRLNKAMADQIHTVSKQRLLNRVGVVSPDEMQAIERTIRVQLNLR